MRSGCCAEGTCEQLDLGELELIAEFNDLGPWNDDNRERKRKIRRELADLRVASAPRHVVTPLPDGTGDRWEEWPEKRRASYRRAAGTIPSWVGYRRRYRNEQEDEGIVTKIFVNERDEVAEAWKRWLLVLGRETGTEMRRTRGIAWAGGWQPEWVQEPERIGDERTLVLIETPSQSVQEGPRPGGSWDMERTTPFDEIREQEIAWERVQVVLEGLDQRDRDLLSLRYLRNLSERAIARRLRISQQAVNKALRRALERARAVEKQGGE